MKIWIDVEDIFQYIKFSKRPSGIQRVVLELENALFELAPNDICFFRHGAPKNTFEVVSKSEINIIFQKFSSAADTVIIPPRTSVIRRIGRQIIAILPSEVADQLRQFHTNQIKSLKNLRNIVNIYIQYIQRRLDKKYHSSKDEIIQNSENKMLNFDLIVMPGDWLISLGSPWNIEDYASMVRTKCALYELNFALLLYDIIPLRRPEWCDYNVIRSFSAWFESVVPLADRIIAISHTTARDAEDYAAEVGIKLKNSIATIPLGTGFGHAPTAVRTERMPSAGNFVLFVSTIEARKNHVLAFRIWRELLACMPREKVPTLVFAGRVGWLVADLMQQLKNADWLGGKIQLIEEPSDSELTALYEDCLFTLYPSLFEGWGLPVTESLAHGTPCLAANVSSLPEAGGTLVRYFDPDNLHDAFRAVRELLEDRAGLAAWRTEIREKFQPISWRESGSALLDLIGYKN